MLCSSVCSFLPSFTSSCRLLWLAMGAGRWVSHACLVMGCSVLWCIYTLSPHNIIFLVWSGLVWSDLVCLSSFVLSPVAIWDVLSNESSSNSDYLRGTIFLPNEGVDALNSVTDQAFLRTMGTPFILHGKTIVQNHLHYAKLLLHVMGVGPRNLLQYCPSVFSRYGQFKNISRAHKDILRYEFTKKYSPWL